MVAEQEKAHFAAYGVLPNQVDPYARTLQSLVEHAQELEQIVTRMEQGQLSLEQSLTAFETGVKLTRNCQETLKKAEQRVNVLVQKAGDAYELRQAELRDADV